MLRDARSWDELHGSKTAKRGTAAADRAAAAQNMHAFRLWERVLKRKFGKG
ncbi:MAG TPA: hypothetical protein PKD99_02255 [Sphingopyxis sp.]|nr:hypothetical protein [Sphingopyxis sp.]HMP43899.1 hypothetical protein [Sphingopyxis sp.]HMQ18066.1 hypothetical protein [Sphingopyxis sp.]